MQFLCISSHTILNFYFDTQKSYLPMTNMIGQIALFHLYVIGFVTVEIYKPHILVRNTVLVDFHLDQYQRHVH